MDRLYNPFTPGAGALPPELAGRDAVLSEVRQSYLRAQMGLPSRSFLLLGLRGVGKTVLLKKMAMLASRDHFLVSEIASPQDARLANVLYPTMSQVLRQLSATAPAKDIASRGLKALRNFAALLSVPYDELEMGITPEPGVADTGHIEYDLVDMFLLIGQAVKAAQQVWILFLDEIHYLKDKDLAALIAALHKSAQKGLPIVFVGAGLPQVTRLAVSAKSYAERLFLYSTIDALTLEGTIRAVSGPLEKAHVGLSDTAKDLFYQLTHGYPFFIQSLAYDLWNIASGPTICADDVTSAYETTLNVLDERASQVRFDRLTDKEISFVVAMAKLGNGPYMSSNIAKALKTTTSNISTIRASLISKGVVFSPRFGYLDFTVPLFNAFVLRKHANQAP